MYEVHPRKVRSNSKPYLVLLTRLGLPTGARTQPPSFSASACGAPAPGLQSNTARGRPQPAVPGTTGAAARSALSAEVLSGCMLRVLTRTAACCQDCASLCTPRTSSHTNRHSNKQTNNQTNKRSNEQANKQASKQARSKQSRSKPTR